MWAGDVAAVDTVMRLALASGVGGRFVWTDHCGAFMRVLRVFGTALGYTVIVALGLGLLALDIWVLVRFGLLAWLISIPVAATLFGVLVAVASLLVYGIGFVIYWVGSQIGRLLGMTGPTG